MEAINHLELFLNGSNIIYEKAYNNLQCFLFHYIGVKENSVIRIISWDILLISNHFVLYNKIINNVCRGI